MEEYSIYEFWNKLPGPGDFESDDFAAIPSAAPLWEAVRIGVMEYLGERWVVEEVDRDNVRLRRVDRDLTFRLKQTFKTREGENDYAAWTTLGVSDAKTFDYMVGAATFRQAMERDLGMRVGFKGSLGPTPPGVDAIEGAHGGELQMAVSLGEPPTATQTGRVARWFIWSVLALQWAAESIEANPNP